MNKNSKSYKLSFLLFILSVIAIAAIFGVYLVGGNLLVDSKYDSRSNRAFEKMNRGKIVDRNGNVLAENTIENGLYKRLYNYPALFSHVIGYADKKYGFTGLESEYNDLLQGRGSSSIITKMDNIIHKDKSGETLYLNLDLEVQKRAKSLLGSSKGVIIVSNPKNGGIICSYSNPNFNTMDIKNELLSEDDRLLDRVNNGKYTPGSVMKIITAINLIEQDYHGEYLDLGYIDVGKGRITNYAKRAYGEIDIQKAFENSVNTFFINANTRYFDSFIKMTKDINSVIETSCRNVYGFNIDESGDDFAQALLAIGQGKITTSPMAINLLTQSIYNEGYFYPPKYVQYSESRNGILKREFREKKVKMPFKEETAKVIKEYMYGVVRNGTAKGFGIWSSGGKTGTAELGDGKYNYIFTGFFHDEENPRVITIVLENSSENGYNNSVRIFKQILNM